MYLGVLKTVKAKRGYSQSDVAKAAGVSRQAVSLWFTSGDEFQNVHVANLLKLSAALDIEPAELLKPFAGIADPAVVRALTAEFCWDRAYADIYGYRLIFSV